MYVGSTKTLPLSYKQPQSINKEFIEEWLEDVFAELATKIMHLDEKALFPLLIETNFGSHFIEDRNFLKAEIKRQAARVADFFTCPEFRDIAFAGANKTDHTLRALAIIEHALDGLETANGKWRA